MDIAPQEGPMRGKKLPENSGKKLGVIFEKPRHEIYPARCNKAFKNRSLTSQRGWKTGPGFFRASRQGRGVFSTWILPKETSTLKLMRGDC
jgi:hypothetical protein